jgi:hypothetical protein
VLLIIGSGAREGGRSGRPFPDEEMLCKNKVVISETIRCYRLRYRSTPQNCPRIYIPFYFPSPVHKAILEEIIDSNKQNKKHNSTDPLHGG